MVTLFPIRSLLIDAIKYGAINQRSGNNSYPFIAGSQRTRIAKACLKNGETKHVAKFEAKDRWERHADAKLDKAMAMSQGKMIYIVKGKRKTIEWNDFPQIDNAAKMSDKELAKYLPIVFPGYRGK